MFDDDGLWPCKCNGCEHEWYASIAAMRADGEAVCPTCGARNFIPPAEFNSAVSAARSGSYDFSYLVRIAPQFRFGRAAVRERPGAA
ncbi:MAG TPA: zinc-ribbon domain-containing protein [Hyphomicrobiaceae bacterium]